MKPIRYESRQIVVVFVGGENLLTFQQADKVHTAEDPDKHIISLAKEEAIEELMLKYGEELKRLIYSYTKSWSQTEDLVQEVFLSIYLKLDTFSKKSTLRTWIYAIAINKCKDYQKSWYFRNFFSSEKVHLFAKSDSETPESQLVQKDLNFQLMDQVMSLPIKYREIILLYYYKDFSVEEITLMTGIKQSTVKTRLKRGRQKLFEEYRDQEKRGDRLG